MGITFKVCHLSIRVFWDGTSIYLKLYWLMTRIKWLWKNCQKLVLCNFKEEDSRSCICYNLLLLGLWASLPFSWYCMCFGRGQSGQHPNANASGWHVVVLNDFKRLCHIHDIFMTWHDIHDMKPSSLQREYCEVKYFPSFLWQGALKLWERVCRRRNQDLIRSWAEGSKRYIASQDSVLEIISSTSAAETPNI